MTEMKNNHLLVTEGIQALTAVLAPFIGQHLRAIYGAGWWQRAVLDELHDTQGLAVTGKDADLIGSLDAARCLTLISSVHWDSTFRKVVSNDQRGFMRELSKTRNQWAHVGLLGMTDDDAWRALDTMARITESMDAEATEKIRELARTVRYGTNGASTAVTPAAAPAPPPAPVTEVVTKPVDVSAPATAVTPSRAGLPPWRTVAQPHPDVAQGRYRQAEFAADLSQVLRGTAQAEYQDPVEFYARTFVTEGMRDLLTQAARRVAGLGGEPVIQLKTAFGGGKTHSMLALYHLLRGIAPLDKMPNAAEVIRGAGVSQMPKARVAILVGTALNPTKTRRPATFPGISIRTLWGEMAAQLAEQAGNPKIYDIVKDADLKSVPPGSETLVELFDAAGPCVVLIDELVAYARKIYGVDDLPSGTFASVLTFVQELTEAARASKNSMVVAAIPESDIEIGGEAGQQALETIEHTFGRMEAIWKPVGAEEGFEIVRRRLFLEIQDTPSRDDVCRAFSQMYRDGGNDFPAECKEAAYLQRLQHCYPIHPEVFDRLYTDWASIPRFQKTRGVLRLMAGVIHELWTRNDADLLIMPGSIPLDEKTVLSEIARYLENGWEPVVETDVDGPRSVTKKIDSSNQRFGLLSAARRVGRTVFLGSAPSVGAQNVRGIEDLRIRLGVVQPGEQVSVFNDALMNYMRQQLTFLYSSGTRYWYDVRPNLRRTVEDRAQNISTDDVEVEIERRLKAIKAKGDFKGVHICPASSLDVTDDQEVRLVVLRPSDTHRLNAPDSAGLIAAMDILENRGNGPRLFRNMLAFVAPDKDIIVGLEQETRRYLAWKSVVQDAEALNLDAHQRKEAAENEARSNNTVDLRVNEAYIWLFTPNSDSAAPLSWEISKLPVGRENYVIEASKRLKSAGLMVTKWSPALLRMDLDKWFWKDENHVGMRKVWEALASYCYLSRLQDDSVFLDAVREGLRGRDYFAYATSVGADGRYQGLQFGSAAGSIYLDASSVLAKPEAALRQMEEDAAKEAARAGESNTTVETDGTGKVADPSIGGGTGTRVVPLRKLPRRFHGTVALDPTRVLRDAGRLAEEIVQHLSNLPDANVRITLDIEADTESGFPDTLVRTITENGHALKFTNQEFEDS